MVAGEKWLDLGCGSGVLTAELMKRGAAVVSIDKSDLMLDMARSEFELGACVSFVHCDAHDLICSQSCLFDGVLCSSLIEYVDDPYKVIGEIGRVLKYDGLLIISIPNNKSFIRRVQKLWRSLFSILGKDSFSYLNHSHFETNVSNAGDLLKMSNLRLTRYFSFDPFIPRSLFSLFHPALMIYEARKSENFSKSGLN